MKNIENNVYKSAIVAAASFGLLLVIATKRKRIYSFVKNMNDPLKHRRIEVIQTIEDCQRVVDQLKM